ncbi:hypothetical protein [Pontiella sp.]|uniref:hypothetical protein n=1 Tax=Pontiella sp. TaxID=2837462 RepID=UPI003564FA34
MEKIGGFERFLSSATVLISGGQVKDLWVKNDSADIGFFTLHLSPESMRSRTDKMIKDKMMRCGRRMGRKIDALNAP